MPPKHLSATLLVKVKAHRGDPLNEEADIMIRAEMGGLKEQQETIWDDLTGRTVYQWSEKSKYLEGVNIGKMSVWTNTVRNQFILRVIQKSGEIEASLALESGTAKWCKEYIPRNRSDPASKEGQAMLHQPEIRTDRQTHQRECHTLS